MPHWQDVTATAPRTARVPAQDRYQSSEARVQSGSQVGFGIGPSISKASVEGHHGHVGLESAPGQGTTI